VALTLLGNKYYSDQRGWFCEIFHDGRFNEQVAEIKWVQDNQSLSRDVGTIRGLHFQLPPHPQAKLVRCLAGAIFDVAVDIRKESPTYGQWIGVELSAENGKQLYIPVGFAHGFMTLEPDTMILYKVSDYYAPDCDRGLAWDDSDIAIEWPLQSIKPILSAKDEKQPLLKDFQSPFAYDGRPMSLTEVVL
jgi:dTDP-4-dehydrorhamnose 3,5-epimerase